MRKLLVILFLLFTVPSHAAPPSRNFTYTTGSVISSSQVTSNEDSIFNYLQAGVDAYADGTIVNADVHSSANIQSDKLNLTAIAQSVANSGSTTLTGNFTASGTTNSIGNGGSDTLTLNVPGGMTLSAATTWTLTGALTFSGTIADLGTVTTANIDGGTIDGMQIGGTTATGELIVNDASDDADGLGSQGTSGQFLQSAGAGVNPTWAGVTILSPITTNSPSSVSTTTDITIAVEKHYLVTFKFTNVSASTSSLDIRFNSDSSGNDYIWVYESKTATATPTISTVGDDADTELTLVEQASGIGAGQAVEGQVFINTYTDDTPNSSITANYIINNAATAYEAWGVYNGGAPTSFEFVSDQVFSGEIRVYEFAQ